MVSDMGVNSTTTPRPNIDLVTGLFCIFSDNLNIVKSWGFYLFSPDFDNELELRNKIGTVWLTSLIDSLEGELRAVGNYRRMANERHLPHLQDFCDQVSLFMECIKEISRRYTREEQIFLSDMRDQLVHSWLARRHAARFKLKYFDGNDIVTVHLTPAEHADIVRPFYFARNLDETLHSLMTRFQDFHLRYWHVIDELARMPHFDQIQDVLLAGSSVRIDALTRPISGPVNFSFG